MRGKFGIGMPTMPFGGTIPPAIVVCDVDAGDVVGSAR
jgi:hypothetical protein